jgi:hypothetical protein
MLGEKSSGENLSRFYVLRVAAQAKNFKSGVVGSAVPTEAVFAIFKCAVYDAR